MSNLFQRVSSSKNSKKSEIYPNRVMKQKDIYGIGNSFYERDENNLYELCKSDKLDEVINYSRNKTNYENINSDNVNFNRNANRILGDKNKLNKKLQIHEMKKNFDLDKYFVPENSPRINRNETEQKEEDLSSSNDEYSFAGDVLLKENVEVNRKLKIFDAKELNDYNDFNTKIDFSLEHVLDHTGLEKHKNYNSLLSNNVILIRPQILASKKQQVYSKLIENNEHDYMYEIIKQNEKDEKIKNEDVEYKIEMFRKFIEDLKLKKYKEKLKFLKEVVKDEEEISIDNENEMRNMNYLRKEENLFSKKKSMKKNISCCEKFNSFIFGNPLRSYAKQKHIWCGEYGAFDYDIQDHRNFDVDDTLQSNSSGE